MIAVDTNVLVRILIEDRTAPEQCKAALALEQRAMDAEEAICIDLLVLVETQWVLSRAYKVSREGCARLIRRLLDMPCYHLPDATLVLSALDQFEQTATDLADCLIAARSAASGARITYTFDRQAAKLKGCTLLDSH